MQSRNQSNAKGIDVSRHQANIGWSLVASSGLVDFAFIKATEGLGYIDPKFVQNAKGAIAAKIPIGFYHYAHPETNKALDEAKAFVEATKGYNAQLPYVLDLEGKEAAALDTATLSNWASIFINTVHALTGKVGMLYTGAYFARDELNRSLSFAPLWIAHYGAATPLANGTWNEWTYFQYSSTGRIPGILGNVDLNEYNGSVADMVKKFKDVPSTYWAADEIAAAVDAGIIEGYPDGTFKPEQPITRAEFASAISKLKKYGLGNI